MRLSSRYKENWPDTQERFELWWQRKRMDRPLIRVTAPRDKPVGNSPAPVEPPLPGKYLNADYIIARRRCVLETTYFGGEAFPVADALLGPGSLALYLGGEPGFEPNTVWFKPCIESLEKTPLPVFNPENHWFRVHLDLIRALRGAFAPDAWTTIPDVVESLDILAAMRGPTELLYDLMDRPAECHRWLARINDLYFPHYDPFYDLVKGSDGSSVFTAFDIWGPGKVCKVQCDFSAMLSPEQFQEFYIPYVTRQIEGLDRVLYHLDGPNQIRHLSALCRLERLHAIQWIPGAGQPDAGDECWYPVCDKILRGGKALHIAMPIAHIEPFIRRFGADGIFIRTSARTESEARELIARSKRLV